MAGNALRKQGHSIMCLPEREVLRVAASIRGAAPGRVGHTATHLQVTFQKVTGRGDVGTGEGEDLCERDKKEPAFCEPNTRSTLPCEAGAAVVRHEDAGLRTAPHVRSEGEPYCRRLVTAGALSSLVIK